MVRSCIYYHPESYSTATQRLMGRQAAGESFLRGYLAYGTSKELWVHVESKQHADACVAHINEYGTDKTLNIINRENLHVLSNAELLYHPGPNIDEHVYRRSIFGHENYSVCGITHTTSSSASMDAITRLVTAPVQTWDAVICTSNAVRENVVRLINAEIEFLKDRLGITRTVIPELPVIPLGIHVEDFNFSTANRIESRKVLQIPDSDFVVLYMGRLSFHAKAHPLAMYQALQNAHNTTGKRITLIECGWFANEELEKSFSEAASQFCPSIKVLKLDGREKSLRDRAWASSDVFCSLADNIQETFGITPIEAMAAGLPAIVSDWDGYKDTIRDRVDGFRIPTTMPVQGLGIDLANRHAIGLDTYDMYIGHASSLISVDIGRATEALVNLISSETLRKDMSRSGKERARSEYDWSKIMPQYEELWTLLASKRHEDSRQLRKLADAWPARMDPYKGFQSYPSNTLTSSSKLKLTVADIDTAGKVLDKYLELGMVNYASYVIPPRSELIQVMKRSLCDVSRADELILDVPETRRPYVFRSIGLLLKLGLMELID